MLFDRYRWQDHMFDPYRWSIDIAVTVLFAVALSASAIVHLTGDQRGPEIPRAFIAQTAAKPAQQSARQALPIAAPDCDSTPVSSTELHL